MSSHCTVQPAIWGQNAHCNIESIVLFCSHCTLTTFRDAQSSIIRACVAMSLDCSIHLLRSSALSVPAIMTDCMGLIYMATWSSVKTSSFHPPVSPIHFDTTRTLLFFWTVNIYKKIRNIEQIYCTGFSQNTTLFIKIHESSKSENPCFDF